jgi:hypothetical protein
LRLKLTYVIWYDPPNQLPTGFTLDFMKLVTVKYIVLRNGVTADFVRYDLLDSLLTVTYFFVHEHVLQWRQGL